MGAYGVGAAELFVIVALLGGPGGADIVTKRNAATIALLLAVSLVLAAISTTKFVHPSLIWFARGEEPTLEQQHAALSIQRKQTVVHVGMWLASGAVVFLVNADSGARTLALIALAVVFGGAVIAFLGYLVTAATLRPVIAAAMAASPPHRPAPGVMQRLTLTWSLCSGLPVIAIAAIIVDYQYLHWVLIPGTPIGAVILIITTTTVFAGLYGTILVSRSVSDPVREVGAAMAEVERGRTDVTVDVHDSSEIGRLQTGFNRMVAEIAERERLRDLFGRHVGQHVAERAMEQEDLLGGDVQVVAVLFIDLAGSTAFASSRPPDEVAELLNEFFHIVVSAVDLNHGLINKFTGDAALAIFGAPEAIDDPAGDALRTARELRAAVQSLRSVDFGIGVSYGAVFAGNIGAEQRYEYTVIGDPVNEAARLTELAKLRDGRILAAAPVVEAASDEEAARWRARGRRRLRGRSSRTVLFEPIGDR